MAPAVLLNPRTVRYTEPDGDLVTVTISKGSFDLLGNFTFSPAGSGEQLQRISLAADGAEFAGASLAIFAQRSSHGDGLADLGYLDARGIDLTSVRVSGDLGRIDAGDAEGATPGIAFLKIGSLGRLGTSTQPPGEAGLASQVVGDLGTLRVDGDIVAASLAVSRAGDGAGGSIGSGIIGGSLRGASAAESGTIHAAGAIGSLEIRGGIVGGSGENSGSVSGDGQLGSLLVGGSLLGGAGARSGSIRAGEILESLVVGGDIAGSAGRPVIISAAGIPPGTATADATSLGQLRIGGSVTFAEILGGYDLAAIAVNGDAQIGRISVAGDWTASTVAAGVVPGPDGLFATADDAARQPNQLAIPSSIETITIAGRVSGTAQPSDDHFGFVAARIGSITTGGKAVPLLPGAHTDSSTAAPRLALGFTGDVRVLELPPPPPPPSLLTAVSRKEHGMAGAFDVLLALSGTAAVESRVGDTLTLIFTFDHDLAAGSAAIQSGSGLLAAAPIFSGHQMIVNLGSVADQQTLVILLSNVTDRNGGFLPTVSIPVSILAADVNATRAVNNTDVNIIRGAVTSGVVSEATFRADLDHNGIIDQTDVTLAQSNSGHSIP